jgi:hypothetical protein
LLDSLQLIQLARKHHQEKQLIFYPPNEAELPKFVLL